MEIMQLIWLVLVVLFVIIEAATISLVSIWFCAGSLVALVVSFFAPDNIALQIISFLVVGSLMLLALRPVTKKIIGDKRVPTNADANIGKTCQVIEEIHPARFGRVNLEGQDWTAKSNIALPVGTWCKVDAIEGVKLVVSPLEK